MGVGKNTTSKSMDSSSEPGKYEEECKHGANFYPIPVHTTINVPTETTATPKACLYNEDKDRGLHIVGIVLHLLTLLFSDSRNHIWHCFLPGMCWSRQSHTNLLLHGHLMHAAANTFSIRFLCLSSWHQAAALCRSVGKITTETFIKSDFLHTNMLVNSYSSIKLKHSMF